MVAFKLCLNPLVEDTSPFLMGGAAAAVAAARQSSALPGRPKLKLDGQRLAGRS